MVKQHHLLRDGMTEEHAWDVLYNGIENQTATKGASTIGRHESTSFGMDPGEVEGKNGTKGKVRTTASNHRWGNINTSKNDP
jgi:hypothetical protein